MLAGKTLVDYASLLFPPYDFEKMAIQFLIIFKMNECSSIETTNIYFNLSDQTKFRLNKINKTKNYFNSEIQERKTMSKNKVNTLLLLIILTRL